MATLTSDVHDSMKLLDIHTHVLPGMDDGAVDEGESEQMLKRLAEQGITTIALTPHYNHYIEPLAEFIARRNSSLHMIEPFADNLGISFIPASETYLTEDLLNEASLEELCFQSTRLLLIEMPFDTILLIHIIALLERMVSNYGITPVLAHIERYPWLFHFDGVLFELLDIGCLMQVNLSSFTKSNIFTRIRLLRLMTDGLVNFIGTDCHRMSFRPPEYKIHMDYLIKKLGYDFMKRYQKDMARMLSPSQAVQHLS